MWSGRAALALEETSSVKYLMLEALSPNTEHLGQQRAVPEPVLISSNAGWQSAVPTRIQLIRCAGSRCCPAASLIQTRNYSVKLR